MRVALNHGLYPVWDDLPERKRELLIAYDEMVCSQCGNLRSECSDPGVQWHPKTSVCYATAAREWGGRRLGEMYAGKQTPDGASYLDGRWVWVSPDPPLEGEDEFAGD